MSLFDRHPRLRWGAPVLAVALVTGGTLASSVTASADPTLPPKTASDLLADVQQARIDGLSGTVEHHADLGLPELDLAGMGGGPPGQQSAGLESTVSGTHTWRIWSAGPAKSRLALLGDRGETHLIRNGQDLWVWSSPDQKARLYQLPQDAAAGHTLGAGKHGRAGEHGTVMKRPDAGGPHASGPDTSGMPRTPQEAADQALAAIEPSTEVTVPGTVSVAGRDAYELRLDPRDGSTLVDAVTIAVDEQTKVPLRVQVFSTKLDTPAFEVGFTDVDFGVPADDNFAFTPPPGAEVEEIPLETGPGAHPAPGAKPEAQRKAAKPGGAAHAPKPQVVGSGWGAVLIGTAGAPGGFDAIAPGRPATGDGEGAQSTQVNELLAQLPATPASSGVAGRVLEGTLFTVVIADDGRIAGGAVGPEKVYAALAAR